MSRKMNTRSTRANSKELSNNPMEDLSKTIVPPEAPPRSRRSVPISQRYALTPETHHNAQKIARESIGVETSVCICTKEVINGEEGIFCESCNSWLHRECTELSRSEFNSLRKSSDAYKCQQCSQNDPILLKIKELRKLADGFTDINLPAEGKCKTLEEARWGNLQGDQIGKEVCMYVCMYVDRGRH